jgi:hypothetical protein
MLGDMENWSNQRKWTASLSTRSRFQFGWLSSHLLWALGKTYLIFCDDLMNLLWFQWFQLLLWVEICTDSGAVADLAAALSGPEQRWAALALYHLARGDGRDRRDRRDGRDGKVQLLCTGEGLDIPNRESGRWLVCTAHESKYIQLSRTRMMLWCNYIHFMCLYIWYVWFFTWFDVILAPFDTFSSLWGKMNTSRDSLNPFHDCNRRTYSMWTEQKPVTHRSKLFYLT